VEVALASGAGAGGGWGSSGVKRRWQQRSGRAEQLEVDDEDLVANTEKPRDSTIKPE
jgi:hypothetical protein